MRLAESKPARLLVTVLMVVALGGWCGCPTMAAGAQPAMEKQPDRLCRSCGDHGSSSRSEDRTTSHEKSDCCCGHTTISAHLSELPKPVTVEGSAPTIAYPPRPTTFLPTQPLAETEHVRSLVPIGGTGGDSLVTQRSLLLI